MCAAATPTADPTRGPSWTSWGGDATDARYAPQGGSSAADMPRLKLKWAFGYEGATSSRVQPALAGGKLFVASDNAELQGRHGSFPGIAVSDDAGVAPTT
jgi:polyvinyl alcohol dehydrogenase (cytochrome)